MIVNLNIRPSDTLFFRDGKPFSMGDESWADGVFPPFPSTILGAIRSWVISLHPNGFSIETVKWVKENVKLKQICFLLEDKSGNKDVYFPLPLDMVEDTTETKNKKRSSEEKYKVVSLDIRPLEDLITASHYQDLHVSHLLTKEVQVEGINDGLILHSDLLSYFNGAYTSGKALRIRDCITNEPKTGIGRSDVTHVVETSKLYRVGMVRPTKLTTKLSFLVEIELPDDLSIEENQLYTIKLGAENKLATLQKWRRNEIGSLFSPDKIDLSSGRFKLYLATPAVFEQGWMPNLAKHGVEAQLVAAVVGKPLFVGGYDVAEGRPKPMVRAVPAGSVYYYETEEPQEKIKEKLFNRTISEKIIFSEAGNPVEVDLAGEGFGMAYLGNW